MKPSELRELPDADLLRQIVEQDEILQHFRLKLVAGSLENVKAAKSARRNIAQIKTIIRERELAAQKKAK